MLDDVKEIRKMASSTGSKRSFARFMAFDSRTDEADMLNAKFETWRHAALRF